MSDVFISYHEESAGELAEQIADALDAAGISAWCARRDMLPGEVFAEEIPKRIHDCRLFLLILNERVYESVHIQTEVGIAFSRVNKGENIRIFPLNVGECPLKGWLEYYLIHPQGVKFPAQPDKKHLQQLVKRIEKALQRETQAAPKIIKRGKCGDNVTFTLDENGILTISGNGPMWDFKWDYINRTRDTPWWEEHETITKAEIQNGVTVIGEGTFDECAALRSVTIPGSVTIIKIHAFYGCKKLTSVTIPDSVTTIGNFAFLSCAGLKSVTIPRSVTTIKMGAFDDCTSLTSVSVPANAYIAPSAFPDNVRIERRK